jgi:hypothetical protein
MCHFLLVLQFSALVITLSLPILQSTPLRLKGRNGEPLVEPLGRPARLLVVEPPVLGVAFGD